MLVEAMIMVDRQVRMVVMMTMVMICDGNDNGNDGNYDDGGGVSGGDDNGGQTGKDGGDDEDVGDM